MHATQICYTIKKGALFNYETISPCVPSQNVKHFILHQNFFHCYEYFVHMYMKPNPDPCKGGFDSTFYKGHVFELTIHLNTGKKKGWLIFNKINVFDFGGGIHGIKIIGAVQKMILV